MPQTSDAVSFLFGGVGVTALSVLLTFWLESRRRTQSLERQLKALITETEINRSDLDYRHIEDWSELLFFTPFADAVLREVVVSPDLSGEKFHRLLQAAKRALSLLHDADAYSQQRNVLAWQQRPNDREAFNVATADFLKNLLLVPLSELSAAAEAQAMARK